VQKNSYIIAVILMASKLSAMDLHSQLEDMAGEGN
jgi:hypothetical protein